MSQSEPKPYMVYPIWNWGEGSIKQMVKEDGSFCLRGTSRNGLKNLLTWKSKGHACTCPCCLLVKCPLGVDCFMCL